MKLSNLADVTEASRTHPVAQQETQVRAAVLISEIIAIIILLNNLKTLICKLNMCFNVDKYITKIHGEH